VVHRDYDFYSLAYRENPMSNFDKVVATKRRIVVRNLDARDAVKDWCADMFIKCAVWGGGLLIVVLAWMGCRP
jgi:hypothetical protein